MSDCNAAFGGGEAIPRYMKEDCASRPLRAGGDVIVEHNADVIETIIAPHNFVGF